MKMRDSRFGRSVVASKKGQVTIFIILGVVIVAGIVLLFLFSGGDDVKTPSDLSPQEAVKKCVRDAVVESIDKMLTNGGEIVPTLSINYSGEEYNYLCYQGDYYLSCYNIHPMLEEEIEG